MESSIRPSKSELLAQLDRITSSQVMGRSKVNCRLIRYLVNCALDSSDDEGRGTATPKEVEIAVDVFGKGSEFNPAEDAFVRVYISNLRKKLEAYYQSEAQDEVFQITIPPGSYGLAFAYTSNQHPAPSAEGNTSRHSRALVTSAWSSEGKFAVTSPVSDVHVQPRRLLAVSLSIVGILFGISLILNIWAYLLAPSNLAGVNHSARTHSLWSSLFSNKKPTLIVIGDLYMLNERDPVTNAIRVVREFSINSDQDLEEYNNHYPQNKLVKSNASNAFILKNSVFSLQHILPLFEDRSQVAIRLVSTLSPSDLRDSNLIYLGLYKSLGPLDAYERGSNFVVDERGPSLVHKSTKEKYRVNGDFDQEYTDYGLFSKYQGPSRNVIYLFSGFSDASIIQMAKYLTNPENLNSKEFAQYFNDASESNLTNFELVFSAASFDRTDLSSTIVSRGEIDVNAIWSTVK